MDSITVITNNHPRELLTGHDLTKEEREELDYLKWDNPDSGCWNANYFRYKGELYDTGEFMMLSQAQKELIGKDWDGIQSDTFFSGILYKYVPMSEYEWIIVGRYYS